jgi:glycosyltransferase involved in cell wall biosynthesis
MKLLHVVHYPVFGGPHNEALRLAPELPKHGWEIKVLLPAENGDAAERLLQAGVDVIQQPLGRVRSTPNPAAQSRLWLGFWGDVQRIRRVIRQQKIDLVTLGGLANPHAAIAACLERIPVVWQVVDTRTPPLLRIPMMELLRRLADSVMFTGASLIAPHVGGRPLAQPHFVYYPPVDTSKFSPSIARRREARLSLGIPQDAPVVGMVANLNPQKGVEYFIRAAGLIASQFPDTRFLIIGPEYKTHQGYAAFLRREIAASEVPENQLILTGSRPDPENLYPAMDVKLITSVRRSEGAPTTAIEASSCGVPVVATDVGAVREVVVDGQTGFIVPPEDSLALSNATLRLLGSPDLRAAMATSGRRRAIEKFQTAVSVRTYLAAFGAAIAHREGKANEPEYQRAA